MIGFSAEGKGEGEVGKESKELPQQESHGVKTIRSEGKTGFSVHALNPDITGSYRGDRATRLSRAWGLRVGRGNSWGWEGTGLF